MRFLQLAPLLAALVLFSATAGAEIRAGGLFVEPAVTYQTGTLKLTYPAPFSSESNETVKGYGLGVRIGGHVADTILLAGDIRYSKPNYESSALGSSAAAQAYDIGATVGLQTPLFGIRVWSTFILDGTLDPEKINFVDVKYTGFNGYRLGAGLYIAVVSINLEYQEAKYKGTDVQSVGPFAGGSLDSVNGTQKSYILSVSFPIAL